MSECILKFIYNCIAFYHKHCYIITVIHFQEKAIKQAKECQYWVLQLNLPFLVTALAVIGLSVRQSLVDFSYVYIPGYVATYNDV